MTGSCDGFVRVVDQVDHQVLDAVVGRGDVRGPMWGWSTDPAEAVPPRALVIVVEVGRRHQDPVPLPQVLGGERALVGERGVDGAEVVRDPRGRPADGPVHVGDGDELGRSVDRLDSAGSHPFGTQQQASGDLEARDVLDRRRGQDPFGASRVAWAASPSAPTSASGAGTNASTERPSHSTVTTSCGIRTFLNPTS